MHCSLFWFYKKSIAGYICFYYENVIQVIFFNVFLYFHILTPFFGSWFATTRDPNRYYQHGSRWIWEHQQFTGSSTQLTRPGSEAVLSSIVYRHIQDGGIWGTVRRLTLLEGRRTGRRIYINIAVHFKLSSLIHFTLLIKNCSDCNKIIVYKNGFVKVGTCLQMRKII